MPTHGDLSAGELDRSNVPPARVAHEPLTGRDGAPIAVEPFTRTVAPDLADSGVARRARQLARNEWRSVPPPGQ